MGAARGLQPGPQVDRARSRGLRDRPQHIHPAAAAARICLRGHACTAGARRACPDGGTGSAPEGAWRGHEPGAPLARRAASRRRAPDPGRFRHGRFEPGFAHALLRGQNQDPPGLRGRGARQPAGDRHHPRHHRHGPPTRHEGDRARGGERGAARLPAEQPLRHIPGQPAWGTHGLRRRG